MTVRSAVQHLVEDLSALLEVPYTDTALGPVVTVADLRALLQRHAPDGEVSPPAPR